MDEKLDFMKKLAIEAGDVLMDFYGADLLFSRKSDNSIVTEADITVNNFVNRAISNAFPNHGIMTEESENSLDRLDSDGLFIVDPLDGTGSFKRREKDFCFLCAYVENGVPILGVVCEPQYDRLFYAEKGNGAYMVSNGVTTELLGLNPVNWENALIGHPKNYTGDKYSELYQLMGICDCQLVRSTSMGTRMMQIATEKTHLILGYTKGLKEWDVAAGQVVVEELGGIVTDIEGNPLTYNKEDPSIGNGVLVANPHIKNTLFNKLSNCYGQIMI